MQSIVYKETERAVLRLDTFLPQGEASGAAIVFFHGSAWRVGSPEQFHPHCQHYASRGMVAMSASYRLNGSTGDSPFDCVVDGRSCVRWIHAHAGELGIDPLRLVVGGASAGGHVAACTVVMDEINDPEDDLSIPLQPCALVLFNPVLDTTETGWAGGIQQLGDRARELSVVHHMQKPIPPTLIHHGTIDKATPIANSEHFAALAHANHSTCVLHRYEGEGHGFFNHNVNEGACYHKTLQATDEFLATINLMGTH